MKNAIAIMSFSVLFMTIIFLKHMGYAPGWFSNAALFAAGIYVYFESFNKYRKLRSIRDTATSKIGALSAGLAEVFGKAKRYPGTFDIYRYLSVRELISESRINLLSLMGITSKETLCANPFFIEDESGVVFINPLDAEIAVDTKTWKDGDYIYRESEIKEGDYVYCIGTAKRKEDIDIVSEINKAIKEAKKSEYTLKRFDTDKDGKISREEWEFARKTIENEVINSNISGGAGMLSISKGKENSVFIISNKKENLLLRKYYTQALLLLLSGIAITGYSLVAVLGK